jgi:8-oxo-dGTP pyrophosphatase MutT (NUDIX family)
MNEERKQLRKQWKKEESAGGIVFKKEGGDPASAKASAGRQIFVLLIMPKGPNFGPPEGYWSFPKGLLDIPGESKEQVAVREVREEGGINAEIRAELGYVQFFRKSKEYGNAIKFVHFYLMEYIDGNPNDHDNEVAQSEWFPLEQVEEKLKWPHDKEIFTKAKHILNSKF